MILLQTRYLTLSKPKMRAEMKPETTELILGGFTASPFTKKRIQQFVRAYKESRP
jgi:hypothetical protein